MNPEGVLQWDPPVDGRWVILRFGYTNNGSHVSTASGDWQGLVLDYMSETHFTRYWATWIRPMLERIGAQAGKRTEAHTSELQSLMRITYAIFCYTKTRDYISITK